MGTESDDFISNYLSYVGITECPTFYHRWCALSMLGAYMGRQYSFRLGHFELYTNLYCMIIGEPGARKSTAIKISKKLIALAGYDFISADKTSKEKFMLDLAGEGRDVDDSEDITEQILFGTDTSAAAEMYIACDEFNDFIGNGNIEFISLLGNLWDYNGTFKNRIKNGKSVTINNPTISILGGNTPVNFAKAFPPDIFGQGFFSRLLLIYGETTGRQITFPMEPDAGSTNDIVTQLQQIKASTMGPAGVSESGKMLLDKIYKSWKKIDDIRFESYSNRRFTHLLKLSLIVSAADFTSNSCITEQHIIKANTILTHTEFLMPKALGEFGKSKNSDTTHKVLQIIDKATKAISILEIWKELPSELERTADLAEILRNLRTSDKIFQVDGGFLAKKKVIEAVTNDTIDYGLLTEEERNMTK